MTMEEDLRMKAEEFVERLLSKETHEQPSDTVKVDQIVLEFPPWFDEKKFNRARGFFWDNCFSIATSMMLGLVAVFSVPSILKVLIGSHRSSTVYTAYRRYLSTVMHVVVWFDNELKPGSVSWKSLHSVRSRHLRASLAGKIKGDGIVSQRDIALTQFGFMGFVVLKPQKFGVRQLKEGDWEAYNHFWKVIGHMIGLQDKYNICRESIEETREVCQVLLERVYTPCLENVPEYFEHMARVMLDGLWSFNPTISVEAVLFYTRYLADVPGYILTEEERIHFQRKLKKKLKGKSLETGIDTAELMNKPALEGLPPRTPRLLYYKDFETLETTPHYKKLSCFEKFKLNSGVVYLFLISTYLGRIYFNLNYMFNLWLTKNFPYLAFTMFGIKKSYVNMFEEDPIDDAAVPKPNAEYYKKKPKTGWFSWLWSQIFGGFY